MTYKTYEPGKELGLLVKCYWTLENPKEDIPQKQRIVPDGCMEMIFNYGDLYKQYLQNGDTIFQPRCFVFGQITSPLDIEPIGRTEIFAVRFYPYGFIPFSPLAVKEMENSAVPLENIFGEAGLNLQTTILKINTIPERIMIIERFLMERLLRPELIDQVVTTTVDTMLNNYGNVFIGKLSQQISVNRRQLERRFSTMIGLSPKQLSKIIRLQATLKLLMSKQFTNLTALAYDGEYYDQAHFIKDFKEFTGLSPKNFYAGNLKMSSLFYGTE